MIIPGRWYSGGMGLDQFRSEMLNDKRIRKLVDYPNAGECFAGIELRGGVCYFLWDRDNPGECEYTSISNGSKNTIIRNLSEYPTFIRWNQALQIVKKINYKKEGSLSGIISTVSPFGLPTSLRGKSQNSENALILHSSGGVGYITKSEIKTGTDLINKHKVLISQTISGNMEVPPFKIIALLKVLKPKEVCTHSYLVAGSYDSAIMAQNLKSYIETKFVRFLLTQSISGIHISRNSFVFVPIQNFSESWNDEKLYKKYGITKEEQAFIDTLIRPME